MATKSIFDCDTLDVRSQPKRQQIAYDDDDLFGFGFGCEEADETDASPKNVSISVTFTHDANDGRKNGKRKAHNISELENERIFKMAKKNAPIVKMVSNGKSQKTECDSHVEEEYKLLLEIGCGTYGRVYKAQWNVTKEVIAIKRLICKLDGPHAVMFCFELQSINTHSMK